jgi:hypothetical protein
LEINVSAADFRDFDREQCGVTLKLWFVNFTDLDARVWFGD